jgi:hypothetical protein
LREIREGLDRCASISKGSGVARRGAYRVVYLLDDQTITVVGIEHRRDVYGPRLISR